MKILVLNAGSSSLKYALFEFPSGNCLLTGLVDSIAQDNASHCYQIATHLSEHASHPIPSYQNAFDCMLRVLAKAEITLTKLNCIAHRVVHGGELFQAPTVMTAIELAKLETLIPLAPLHNPSNILGLKTALQLAPQVPQIAVFDTAFHQTLPNYAYRYPLPEDWYQQHSVRRYGFHGTSHAYVAKQAAKMLKKPLAELNLISLHLGNGGSACAIKQGKSIDTSMGFSPLAGLMMGTRCGDIDSSIYPFIAEQYGFSIKQIHELLNKHSGLKGIAGTQDMRQLHELIAKGNAAALLALNMFCYRIKKYIGAYFAVLGQIDALIFTGGIGENDPQVRAQSCADLNGLGLVIDAAKNDAQYDTTAFIQAASSTAILVIKTDEALEIAQQAAAIINLTQSRKAAKFTLCDLASLRDK